MRSDIIVGRLTEAPDSSGTYAEAQIAIWVENDGGTNSSIHLFVRAVPTKDAPRPRWMAGYVPASLWPGRNASMRQGAIGTLQGYLRQKMSGAGEVRVEGLWKVEMTDADREALDTGATQPNSLFTRIARVFDDIPPRIFTHDDMLKTCEWLVDGPILALGTSDPDLGPWTKAAVSTSIPTAFVPTADPNGITLADGTVYVPKALPNRMTDVDFLRAMRDAGIIVFLHGEPGTGKSRVIEAAFSDHIRKEVDEDTARQDIVGGWLEGPDGNLIWVPGVLQEAMTAHDGKGTVLFIDEAPLADSRALASIYAAIDGRRQLTISENRRDYPKPITAGPDFYVILAGNLNVPGAVLSEALSSRAVTMVEFCTDYDVARKIMGPDYDEIITVAANTETRRQMGSMGQAVQMRDLLGYKAVAEVAGTQIALSNLIGKFRSESDRDVLMEVIGETLGVSNVPPLRF